MYEENGFVPKIYLCGDKAEFFAFIGQRPFQFLGELKFFGDKDNPDLQFNEDGKFFLDDKICEPEEIKQILNDADYIVFNDPKEMKATYVTLQKFELSPAKLITKSCFKSLPTNQFYDIDAELKLMNFLKIPPIKTLLDVDAHFAKSPMYAKALNDLTEIDCISQETLPPIKENIYTHVYKNLSECRLKHYDAVLLNCTSSKDFLAKFSKLEHISEAVLIYVRNNSEMHKFLNENSNFFSKVNALTTMDGRWLFCYRHVPKKNFAVYVVTHKSLPPDLEENLSEGYKIIHAGRTLAEDLGYMGDNTGENISYLNPYINELTALYWMWKNTNHTIIGTAHYRRFLTADNDNTFSTEKILTEEQAENFFEDYDLLATPFYGVLTQSEEIALEYSDKVEEFARAIIEKHMMNNQPDYVDAFNFVMNSASFYRYSIMVTRKNIFDSYCAWLFSFFIDATNEIIERIQFSETNKRLAGFFGERMLTVWLIKNRLRIKECNMIQVPDL